MNDMMVGIVSTHHIMDEWYDGGVISYLTPYCGWMMWWRAVVKHTVLWMDDAMVGMGSTHHIMDEWYDDGVVS